MANKTFLFNYSFGMRVSQSERRISLGVTHVPCNIKYCPCLKLSYDNHCITTCFLATTSPFLTHGCCYVLRSSIQVSLCDHSHIPTALTLTRLFARCVKIYHQAHTQAKQIPVRFVCGVRFKYAILSQTPR